MDRDIRSAEEKLFDNGYEDIIIFKDFSYDSALVGISNDNRAIYDYELMIEYLMEEEGWTEEESIDWLEYNTIRSLPYAGDKAPIIMYRLLD